MCGEGLRGETLLVVGTCELCGLVHENLIRHVGVLLFVGAYVHEVGFICRWNVRPVPSTDSGLFCVSPIKTESGDRWWVVDCRQVPWPVWPLDDQASGGIFGERLQTCPWVHEHDTPQSCDVTVAENRVYEKGRRGVIGVIP